MNRAHGANPYTSCQSGQQQRLRVHRFRNIGIYPIEQRTRLGYAMPHMEAQEFLTALAADIDALQGAGTLDPAYANAYGLLLTLGTASLVDRALLAERAVMIADSTDALHLRIVARVIALSHVPEFQRSLASELSALLRTVELP